MSEIKSTLSKFSLLGSVCKSKKYFLPNFLFASDRRNILHDSFEVTFDPSKYSKIRKRNSFGVCVL